MPPMRRLLRHAFTVCSVLSLLLFAATAFVWGVQAMSYRGQWFEVVTLWPGERARVSLIVDHVSSGLRVVTAPDPRTMGEAERAAWRARPRTFREWRQFGFFCG